MDMYKKRKREKKKENRILRKTKVFLMSVLTGRYVFMQTSL